MPVTTPDKIFYADTGVPSNDVVVSATEASSVQAALALRQRYDFTWETSAARTAQEGMVPGSRGYQINTKTEYIYENSAWRIETPYAEYTASKSIPNNDFYYPIGVLSLDTSASTSSVMASATADGRIALADPGIYIVTMYSIFSAPVNARTFGQINTSADSNVGVKGRSPGVYLGDDRLTVMAMLRAPTSGYSFYLQAYQNNGATVTWNTRVSIARIG